MVDPDASISGLPICASGSDGGTGLLPMPSKSSGGGGTGREKKSHSNQQEKNHIKKPLNAFMLYMKEMRPKIVAECTLKESAAINQILGRRVRIDI